MQILANVDAMVFAYTIHFHTRTQSRFQISSDEIRLDFENLSTRSCAPFQIALVEAVVHQTWPGDADLAGEPG